MVNRSRLNLIDFRLFKLGFLLLFLAVFAISALVQHRAHRLAEQQAAVIKKSFIEVKREELKNYVNLALSSIDALYKSGRNDFLVKQQAKELLVKINYGNDGYFFVYDTKGNSLVHPRQPQLVGHNHLKLVDSHGRYVIRALIEAAIQGDGYYFYDWVKPSSREVMQKISYVVLLEQWGWVVGTGMYLDDVQQAMQEARDHGADTLQKLMLIALIAVLTVFAGGLALSISEHRLAEQKLKTMAQRIVTMQEEERRYVARELHDGISQMLVATKYQFEFAHDALVKGSVSAVDDLNKGVTSLTMAIGDVRRISHKLRPAILDTLGLSAALTQLATEFEQNTHIQVNVETIMNEIALPEHEVVALFRITQEALSNVQRHAFATKVTIILACDTERLRLTIADNRRGFNVVELRHAQGIGLRNIRERVEFLGGYLDLTSTPGSTVLTVNLPANLGEDNSDTNFSV